MPDTPTHTATTVQDAIAMACREAGSHILYAEALPDGQWRTLGFGDFLSLARKAAGAIIAAGVKPGQRVALVAANSHLWTAAHTGILLAGAIAVPLDARLSTEEIANVLKDSGAALAIFDNGSKDSVRNAGPSRSMDIDNLGNAHEPPRGALPGEGSGKREDTACLLYTSGTTGKPKAVVLSHENLLSNAEALFEAGIISETDNVLALLPLHHTYSYMCTFLAPVLLGASITVPEELKGPALISASRQRDVTIIPAVPQLLELFHMRAYEKIGAMGKPLAALMRLVVRTSGLARRITGINVMGIFKKPFGKKFRFLTSGGARLDPAVMTELEALGFTIVEGYGLTETSPIVAFNPPGRRKPGSVGLPVHRAEIKIISPGDTGIGEIAIKGPMVTSGYWRNDRETAGAFSEGWFLSGDLGRFDPDGYLRITGRIKEVLVLSSGKNVYPDEVERHYMACPLIRELCVYEDKGQVKAAIVPDYAYMKDHAIGNAAEAVRWQMDLLSRDITPHNRVHGYSLRSEPLPRTPLGKIQRFLVQQQAVQGRLSERHEDGSMDANKITRRVRDAITGVMKDNAPVRASDNLELDLALDSLLRLALAVSLERQFSLKIPDDFMGRMHTAGELAAGIRELVEGGATVIADIAGNDENSQEGLDAILARTPAKQDLALTGSNVSPLDRAVTFLGFHALKAVAKLYFRLESRGLENLPQAPYIIAPNHTSFLDPFIMALSLPYRVFRKVKFIGYERFFRTPHARYLAKLAHVIPIDPETNLGSALSMSAHCLRSGLPLMLFPEGGRSMDGNLLQFKPGVGILALKLGVPVVPVYVDGAHRALPKGGAWPMPVKIRVNFGEPEQAPDAPQGANGTDQFAAFANMLREKMLTMSAKYSR